MSDCDQSDEILAPRDTAAAYYSAGITLLASIAALASLWISLQYELDLGSILVLSFLTATMYISAKFEIQLTRSTWITGEFVPIVVAAVVFPPAAALLGLVVASLPYPNRRSRIMNTACAVVAGAVAAGLSLVLSGSSVPIVAFPIILLPTLTFAQALLIGPWGILLRGFSLRDFSKSVLSATLASCIILAPLLAGILYAYEQWGDPALIVILLPLAISQYFLNMYKRKVELTEELLESAQVLAKTNLQLAMAMVRALDARDAYTAGHSAAVAVYTRDIALEAGHDEATARKAHLAGLLHDIGKIGVPGSVLNKQSRLTDEEFEMMKDHAKIGADILGEVDSYSEISTIVRHHHERIDGRGYPDQIGGELIPAISRMIGVADTYSAMTTDRPYRKGLDPQIAIEEIAKNRGTQLDELYVDAFLRVLERGNDAYKRGKQTDFEVEIAKHQALGEFEAKVLVETGADEADLIPVAPAAEGGTEDAGSDGELVTLKRQAPLGQTTKPIGMDDEDPVEDDEHAGPKAA